MPAVSSHARQQRRVELPKPQTFRQSFAAKTAVSGSGDGRKMMSMSWGSRFTRWRHPKPAEPTARKGGFYRGLSSLIAGVLTITRKRRWQGYEDRSSSFRLVPCAAGEVAGKRRSGRIGFVAVGRVSGRSTAPVTLSHVCMCSPVSSFFFYFYSLFNRLIFFIHLRLTYSVN